MFIFVCSVWCVHVELRSETWHLIFIPLGLINTLCSISCNLDSVKPGQNRKVKELSAVSPSFKISDSDTYLRKI